MHRCRILSKKGASDATAYLIGHADPVLPEAVERLAADMAAGKGPVISGIPTEDGFVILLRVSEEPWLVGGEAWRQAGANLLKELRSRELGSCLVAISGDSADVVSLIEGMVLGDYRYDACRAGKPRPEIVVRVPGHAKAVAAGVAVGECQNVARSLADSPPNLLHPKSFISEARKQLRGLCLSLKTWEGIKALEEANFPGLVQVGQAGSQPPALLQITYQPSTAKAAGRKKKKRGPHLALVGKGITFDTGGISLKPGANMWEMKGDMGGAAAVFGAMRLIALQKPDIAVTGYIALAENMPDSKAQRPGNIYQTRKGHFVHVDNTDAEGRLVLGDVLTYACEQGASHIVDAATLTGACLVALGKSIAAVMGTDEELVQAVRQAGQERGEEFWPMPLYGEYRKLLDHPHADCNNIGGRYGGTLTAGLFLKEYLDPEVAWAHCDIAGPGIRTDGWRYFVKGNTGFGVRSFAQLAQNLG